ncbi:hypothetical protein D3C79_1076320 [compost metagenome]
MLFFRLPCALVVALDDHMNALNHVAVRIVLERDDALETQNVRTLCLGDILYPWKEFRRINFTSTKRNGCHRHIMDR